MMMITKHGEITNYEELYEFAMKHYDDGASQFVECYNQAMLDADKELGYPLTWEMVATLMDMERDEFAAMEDYYGAY